MARNTEIITVSIPKEQEEFLAKVNLSPSKLIQSKIQEVMEHSGELTKALELAEQYKKISASNIQAFSDFLSEKDISYDEFMNFKERRENGSHQLV